MHRNPEYKYTATLCLLQRLRQSSKTIHGSLELCSLYLKPFALQGLSAPINHEDLTGEVAWELWGKCPLGLPVPV
jgi:hypothetical protein